MTLTSPVQHAVHLAIEGRPLTVDEMRAAVSQLMSGETSEALTASFLTALRMKGETVDELVGAAQAMRERATPIAVRSRPLLDTCGTGGDRLHTFNISTATALVVAAAGVRVAKHGNRSVSSTSGSADVLEALGVRIDLSPERVARCIEEIGLGFCFAPLLHGAMKHVAPVRKQLGFRTIFNLLGPLTNPAGAEFQLIGTHDSTLAGKMAQALARLGAQHALVVSGGLGLDEVSLWGETAVFEILGGTVHCRRWTAETFGLEPCSVEAITVQSPAESADRIRRLLNGEQGPARDIVVANAAAALFAADENSEPFAAARRAETAIDSGAARRKLEALIAFTRGAVPAGERGASAP